MPSAVFPIAAVPVAFVPILFDATTLFVPATMTPSAPLPLMTFAVTVLFEPPRCKPSRPFGTAAVPAAFVPM